HAVAETRSCRVLASTPPASPAKRTSPPPQEERDGAAMLQRISAPGSSRRALQCASPPPLWGPASRLAERCEAWARRERVKALRLDRQTTVPQLAPLTAAWRRR